MPYDDRRGRPQPISGIIEFEFPPLLDRPHLPPIELALQAVEFRGVVFKLAPQDFGIEDLRVVQVHYAAPWT